MRADIIVGIRDEKAQDVLRRHHLDAIVIGVTEKKNPLGPTGERLRTNIQRIRTDKRISYRVLADRLEEIGRPIPTLGLSRLENGDRRVDADDLMALALALEVAPNELLLAPHDVAEVALAPAVTMPLPRAWTWAAGSAVPDVGVSEIEANIEALTPVMEAAAQARHSGVGQRLILAAVRAIDLPGMRQRFAEGGDDGER
jgi:transcriptional regulator with XRE-family HTH domain